MQRVPRDQFGVVGSFPLTGRDVDAFIFPAANADERQALLEGLTFFTTAHTAAEGAGPDSNQPFCQGCHLNSAEQPRKAGLLITSSHISRAARSTPTNFEFTALDPASGPCPGATCTGGRAPDQDEVIDPRTGAVSGTGRTAAFTQFGDFSPATDSAVALFDPLDETGPHFVQPGFGRLFPVGTPGLSQFGGVVQHVRPSLAACLPDRIPPINIDPRLNFGLGIDPATGRSFRRAVGERAGPPYVGRGLMEAADEADILSLEDPQDTQAHRSSLNDPGAFPDCSPGDCIAGRHNQNNSNQASGGVVGGDLPERMDRGITVPPRLGRFGLRAAGPTLVQFVIGGMQGEVGFTNVLRTVDGTAATPPVEVNQADINKGRAGCTDTVPDPEASLSTVCSLRTLLRLTPPPEFGDTLLDLLESSDPMRPRPGNSPEARVQRGAILFGVDLRAFANRMIPGRMPPGGSDGLDKHAINQVNRWLNCVGCHTPILATGTSPAAAPDPLCDTGTRHLSVGARHLSFVWAPIFSDLLLHKMTVIDAERLAPTPRDPLVVVRRVHRAKVEVAEDEDEDHEDHGKKLGHDDDKKLDHDDHGKKVGHDDDEDVDRDDDDGDRLFDTFDLPRNLADDALPTQGVAKGDMWRTPPLMGLGRVGPPFLHDARVYLSVRTLDATPAGTVTTSSEFTNAPLVVRTFDDALRAVIELHDLPPPDDDKTPDLRGAGCPVPPNGRIGAVDYGSDPENVICPPYASDVSKRNRSEAREVIRRYRALSPEDQQALIDFLKEL